MKNKLPRLVLTILGVLVALIVLRAYWRHQGAADAKLNATDAAHVAHVDSLERWARDRKRVEDSLRVRVADAESLRVRAGRRVTRLRVRVDTLRVAGDTAALVAGLDSVISEIVKENDSLREQVDIWKRLYASADSGRTVFHAALHESEALKESWKREAQRPRYTLTDIGGAALAGHGIADGNQTEALVGAAVVVVPRLLGAVRRLF